MANSARIRSERGREIRTAQKKCWIHTLSYSHMDGHEPIRGL